MSGFPDPSRKRGPKNGITNTRLLTEREIAYFKEEANRILRAKVAEEEIMLRMTFPVPVVYLEAT